MAGLSKKTQAWAMPTAAGVVGLGLGYWFGKKQTTAPGGRALPAGQVSFVPNFSRIPVGSTTWNLRTQLDVVAYDVVHAIYPPGVFTADPCRDWLSTPLARQRSYVTAAAQRGVSLGGYSVDAVVGAISAQCSGRAIATPVASNTAVVSGALTGPWYSHSSFPLVSLNDARKNAYNLLQARGYTCAWWVGVQDVSRLAALNYVLNGNMASINGNTVASVRDALTAWCKSVVNASQNITV